MMRGAANYILTPYLDSPTPESLPLLPAPGERESVVIKDQRAFVYVLLTKSGKRYEGGYGIPQLPREIRDARPSLRSKVRKLIRGETALNVPAIESGLEKALSESSIVEHREGVYGIFGATESEIRHLLYMPADTPEQADEKIGAYRKRVTAILQPHRLECVLKIKPLLKPGNILRVPTSLKESYFGSGC